MKIYSASTILKIAFPILVSTLMEQIIGLTDTAFLGRVGETELGASALAGVLYIVIFMVGFGFCTGAQIMMGHRNGEGKFEEIGPIFYHSLAFLLLMAAMLFGLSRLFVGDFLRLVVSNPAVQGAAGEYLHYRVIGFFFAFAAMLFRCLYVATMNTKTLTLNSIVMVLSNVVFNYVLIFGHFGAPRMGIGGAALGSAMAEGVSLLFYVLYTWRKVDLRKYCLDRLPSVRRGLLGSILKISSWTMVQDVVALGTWFIFFLAVEHLGQTELAISNVIRNVSSVCFMAVSALAATSGTLTSNLMGADEKASIAPMLRRTMLLGVLILTPLLAVICAFPREIMGIFTDDARLIAEGALPLCILCVVNLIAVPAMVMMRAVSGSGNTQTALWTECVALVAYVVYIGIVIFGMRAPLWICLFCEYIYYLLVWLTCGAYMRWGKWYEKKV